MPEAFLEYDNQVRCLRLAIAVITEERKAVLRPTRKSGENIGRLEVEKLMALVGGPLPICRNIARNPTELKPYYYRSNKGLVACRSCPIEIF